MARLQHEAPVDPELGGVHTRGFIVGCPRSGTTLLQAFLDGHPQILMVGETHFFRGFSAARLARIGLIEPRAGRFIWRRLSEPDQRPKLPLRGSHAKRFRRTLDERAVAAGANVWLEKTPGHIYELDTIRRHLPDSRFVHIVRNGPDVVASLHAVSRAAPRAWGGPFELDMCIDRWLAATRATEAGVGDDRHLLVRYRDLVCDPRRTLEEVTAHLDIPFSEQMFDNREQFAEHVQLPWHAELGGQLEYRPLERFERSLTPEQQRHVLRRLDAEAPRFAVELHALD